MAETVTLRRTGDLPFVFDGLLIAESTGETVQDTGGKLKHNLRWYEAAIYHAPSTGVYYWAIRYRTTWRNEINHDAAGRCETLAEVVEAIRAYNPLACVAGMPFRERTNWRQDQLLQAMRLAWGEVASELFEAAGIVDAGDDPPPIRVFLRSADRPEMLRGLGKYRWRSLRQAVGARHELLGFRTLVEAEAACKALKTVGVDAVPFTLD